MKTADGAWSWGSGGLGLERFTGLHALGIRYQGMFWTFITHFHCLSRLTYICLLLPFVIMPRTAQWIVRVAVLEHCYDSGGSRSGSTKP